jgi:arabinofuranosyltransferase
MTSEAPPLRVRISAPLQVALLAFAPAVVGVMGWSRRWMSDDGYIHLRVVDQLLHGNGLVFNAGERVEATTSPLWVLTLAGLHSIVRFVQLPWLAVTAGLVASVFGLAAAELGAARLLPGGHRRVLVPAGALLIAALPPFWDFATSGLETGLTFAWLGGSFWLAAACVTSDAPSRRDPRPWWAAVVFGAGWIIRPDLIVFTLAFLGALVVHEWRTSWRRPAGLCGAAAAIPVAYQVFRMGYYALLVPNTALAKEAGVAQWSRGWTYLGNTVSPYWLWVPLLAVGVLLVLRVKGDIAAGSRRASVLTIAVLVAALANGVYYVGVGGDFMHARALLPAIFALVMPVSVVEAPAVPMRATRFLPVAATAVIAVWAVVCAFALRFDQRLEVVLGGMRFDVVATDGARIVDARQSFAAVDHVANPVTPDDFAGFAGGAAYDGSELRELSGSGERILLIGVGPETARYALEPGFRPRVAASATAVGVLSYEAGPDVYVIDVHGLGEPVGSHLEGLSRERSGHQKTLGVDWIVARFADANASSPGSPITTDQLGAARKALSCGQLRELLSDVESGLGVRRFLHNVAASFANTSFRVPTRPADAVGALC